MPNRPSEFGHAPRLDEVHNRLRPDYPAALDCQSQAGCCPTPACRPTFLREQSRSDESEDLQGRSACSSSTRWWICLLNYNRFMESKTSIKPMIKVPEPEENKQAGVGSTGAAE